VVDLEIAGAQAEVRAEVQAEVRAEVLAEAGEPRANPEDGNPQPRCSRAG